MRANLIIYGTAFVAGAGALLLWRPALALALAIVGGGLNLWRQHRPSRAARLEPEVQRPAPVVRKPVPPTPIRESEIPAAPESPGDLTQRLRAAGWTIVAAKSALPWLATTNGAVRVALRPGPAGPRATADDIAEAMAAKALEGAQYAAIVCEQRPAPDVMALAKEHRIHVVNLARLEAYLALAASFKPTTPARPVPRSIPA